MVTAEPAGFTPNVRQAELWAACAATPPHGRLIAGYGGAVGGGKTRSLAELAKDLSLDFPGNRILVGRKDLDDLKRTTLLEFEHVCPRYFIRQHYNDRDKTVVIRDPEWPRGVESAIVWSELKDWAGLGSTEFGAVLLEEAGEIPEGAPRMLITRLRWNPYAPDKMHPGVYQRLCYLLGLDPTASVRSGGGRNLVGQLQMKYYLIAASNPWPGWFERWFIHNDFGGDPELDPTALLQAVGGKLLFVPARIADNAAHLPENYEELQRAVLPPDWVDRFIEGRFEAFMGQVYPEFGAAIHQWVGDLPPMDRFYGGLDFGGQNPWAHATAGLVGGRTTKAARCGAGRLIRLAEFKASGPNVHTDLVEWMAASERNVRSRILWRADKSQMFGVSLLQEQGYLVNLSHGGEDSVRTGIGIVRRRLLSDPSGQPGSYYLPHLREFAAEMRGYRWAEPANDDQPAKRKPIERNDDLMDADRYMHEELDGFPTYTGPAVVRTRPRRDRGRPRGGRRTAA